MKYTKAQIAYFTEQGRIGGLKGGNILKKKMPKDYFKKLAIKRWKKINK